MDIGRKDSKRNLYSEKDKDKRDSNNHINEKDFCSRPNDKQNYFKDSRSSSNNLILKTALLIQDGLVYEKYVSEARITQPIDQVISNQKLKTYYMIYSSTVKKILNTQLIISTT